MDPDPRTSRLKRSKGNKGTEHSEECVIPSEGEAAPWPSHSAKAAPNRPQPK
jgi:hypothetical protein